MTGAAPDRALAELLAELLAPTIAEAVRAEVREALAEQLRPPAESLLTIQQSATLAAVHPESIRRAVKRGALPAVRSLGRHPRIRRSDLELFLAPSAPAERRAK